jgi:PST family polysaccharide transporter
MGKRVSHGFTWLFANQIATKCIAFGTQLILAWLLAPEDFGLVGLTYTVMSFASLLQYAGVEQILVQRRNFRAWALPGFWLSAIAGSAAMAFMFALAPVAAWMYSEPELVGLICLLALTAPIQSLAVVPRVVLLRKMNFKALAAILFLQVVIQSTLSICFASVGFGAYSFIIPQPISLLFLAIVLWIVARPQIKIGLKINLKRCRYILGDATKALGGDFLSTLIRQADYVALGLFHTAFSLGHYFFAFNLSTATLVLLTQNLRRVLFPAFSELSEDKGRQAKAFIRASQLLALIAIPLCYLQAALAAPVLRLVFDPRWQPTIPLVVVLSVGMSFRVLYGPCIAYVQSLGRFGLYFKLNLGYASAFVISVLTAAWLGSPLSVAVTVSVVTALSCLCWFYVSVRQADCGIREVFYIFGLPQVVSFIAFSGAFLSGQWIFQGTVGRDVWQIAWISTIGFTAYALMIWVVAPQAVYHLVSRLKSV